MRLIPAGGALGSFPCALVLTTSQEQGAEARPCGQEDGPVLTVYMVAPIDTFRASWSSHAGSLLDSTGLFCCKKRRGKTPSIEQMALALQVVGMPAWDWFDSEVKVWAPGPGIAPWEDSEPLEAQAISAPHVCGLWRAWTQARSEVRGLSSRVCGGCGTAKQSSRAWWQPCLGEASGSLLRKTQMCLLPPVPTLEL